MSRDEFFDLVAAVLRERAGDDDRLAGQLPCRPAARRSSRPSCRRPPLRSSAMISLAFVAVQKVEDALRRSSGRSPSTSLSCSTRRLADRVDRAEMLGQTRRPCDCRRAESRARSAAAPSPRLLLASIPASRLSAALLSHPLQAQSACSSVRPIQIAVRSSRARRSTS